jgi:hypothetical protein
LSQLLSLTHFLTEQQVERVHKNSTKGAPSGMAALERLPDYLSFMTDARNSHRIHMRRSAYLEGASSARRAGPNAAQRRYLGIFDRDRWSAARG